ncbi:cytochrome c peroxidase [Neobacillus sp. FSL H8-0543]|uniref:cytochrome-c peroxidase n=1 Tax=Neobacillus sp. FSL H8-0543 TaxID=2954672 RepID=UPI003158A1D2
MEKYLRGLILLLLLVSIGLGGCGEEDAVAPTKQSEEKQQSEEKGSSEIDPKELRTSLLNHTTLVPLGDVPIPEDNPMTPEVLELGQTLFFDPRLSGNNEVSCATCHDPNQGYGDAQRTFTMYNGGYGKRNSPTVINAGYYTANFWDGRAASLEEQALGPIENPDEMNQPLPELISELKTVKGYDEQFNAAFGNGITVQNIAKALAAFQRQIVVKDTSYDRFLRGDSEALTNQEIRGLDLYTGKALCVTCHNGPNLSDNNYYNIGLNTEDEGRFAVTGDPKDLGRIRTPSLYAITHTAPYMRDGSLETLEEVIDYYDRGGDDHPNKSFFMKQFMEPIGLTNQEKEDLLAFLKTLGGKPPVFTKPEHP